MLQEIEEPNKTLNVLNRNFSLTLKLKISKNLENLKLLQELAWEVLF